jgi:hypothetical protein
MKTYKRIVAIMFVLALILPTITVSAQTAPRSAAITFTTPTPNPVVVGSEVVFDLVISTTNVDPGVSGADIYVKYNSALVGSPASPTAAFAEVLPDFFGASNFSVNEVTQCPGSTDSCIHLVLAGPPQVTHSGVAARFHFRGLAEGNACFSVVQSTLADANGFQVSHTIPQERCVTVRYISNATGTVLRQGMPANPNPGGGTLACSEVTANGVTVKTDVSGKFTLTNLPTGTYAVRATYPGYLASEKTITVTTGSLSPIEVGTTTLRGGDVNNDAKINILDIGTITGKFGKAGFAVGSASAACNVADEPADINDDGQVNISDLAIAAGNWVKTGPTPWQ